MNTKCSFRDSLARHDTAEPVQQRPVIPKQFRPLMKQYYGSTVGGEAANLPSCSSSCCAMLMLRYIASQPDPMAFIEDARKVLDGRD